MPDREIHDLARGIRHFQQGRQYHLFPDKGRFPGFFVFLVKITHAQHPAALFRLENDGIPLLQGIVPDELSCPVPLAEDIDNLPLEILFTRLPECMFEAGDQGLDVPQFVTPPFLIRLSRSHNHTDRRSGH
ncbi:MAG: hypothetical protein BWY82_00352 [Verrucomicrobia bacterium ADurb.Bin474]|nr:MAG: hypothetical protein BWY82_00352 [Verrucomicrobia bacterium ADurb.Bin474]